jgi:hypothetical protein
MPARSHETLQQVLPKLPALDAADSGCHMGVHRVHRGLFDREERTVSENYLFGAPVAIKTSAVVVDVANDAKQANWVQCELCGHRWIGFYLPMPINVAAKVIKKITCPMCGAGSKSIIAFSDSLKAEPAQGETK